MCCCDCDFCDMKNSFFCTLFIAIGARAQIKIAENVANSDQNTASGKIDNAYFGGGVSNLNEYEGIYGTDLPKFLLDRKIGEKFERYRGNYRFNFDDGNPDIHGRIQRPCQVYDTYCIRKFFAQHSQCKISGRQIPEPLYRAQSTFNIPNTNVSATIDNIEYRGIKDGTIQEFYIDKATDNLVITVDFDQVTFSSRTVYLKYNLRGREPVVTRDAAGATFVSVSVTAVIPNLKDLKLDRAEIFTFADELIPPFLTGPRLALSTDPEVVAMFAETVANSPVAGRESLLTEGNYYIANFIQYNICDFGLKAI